MDLPTDALPPEVQAQTPLPAPTPPPPAPAAPPPAAPPPDLVPLNIGGQTYRIERGLADLLNQQQAAPPPPPPSATPPAPDLNTLWYTNPAEAARLIREQIAGDLRQEYQRDMVEREFWSGLHNVAPELRSIPRQFVQDVIQRRSGSLRGLPDIEGMQRIRAFVQEEVLAMQSAFGQAQPTPPQPPAFADTGSAAPVAPVAQGAEPSEDQQPLRLSDIIRQRRAIRRKAMGSAPAAE